MQNERITQGREAYPSAMVTKRLRDRATRLAFLVIGAALVASALSACGSANGNDAAPTATDPAAPTTTPTTDPVKPAAGPMLSAQGFSFHAPHGWADVTDRAETGVLLSAAHLTDEQPLMINVRRVSPGAQSKSASDARAAALLRSAGATGVRTLPSTKVAGFPASHLAGKQNVHGVHYQLDVYYVRTPKAGWSLSFATNQFTTPERRAAMLASVLQTCHWDGA
jgi:hypothetical protein